MLKLTIKEFDCSKQIIIIITILKGYNKKFHLIIIVYTRLTVGGCRDRDWIIFSVIEEYYHLELLRHCIRSAIYLEQKRTVLWLLSETINHDFPKRRLVRDDIKIHSSTISSCNICSSFASHSAPTNRTEPLLYTTQPQLLLQETR